MSKTNSPEMSTTSSTEDKDLQASSTAYLVTSSVTSAIVSYPDPCTCASGANGSGYETTSAIEVDLPALAQPLRNTCVKDNIAHNFASVGSTAGTMQSLRQKAGPTEDTLFTADMHGY